MTRRAAFSQTELTRALKAIIAANLQVSKVDIEPDGKISIFVGAAQMAGVNEWDEVLKPDWREKSPIYHPELAKPKQRRGFNP